MFFKKEKIKLVTHNNRFHPDDVFATATLLIMLGKEIDEVEIIRTRDKKIIDSGDYVYDVGGIYDSENNRFDHHQKEFREERENGIPYSSFGLVWRKFGPIICGNEKNSKMIDKKMVQSIDAMDNGIEIYKPIYKGVHPYLFSDIIFAFEPAWPGKSNFDELFLIAVKFSKRLLEREIQKTKNFEKVEKELVDIYEQTKDKRIIVLERDYPWENILNRFSEPLYVVKKRTNQWTVKAVRDDFFSFKNRKNFPKEWAGKNGKDLIDITGVKDAIFCHNALFICSAESKEGAIKLAELALKN